ncbi:hypothetical protein CAL7102_00137 [Dulcicalothrix desertica PCC 7102]|nr:hypothetical protein CAL7102_00137 [Dulcicalothrix desertica PCC 7102]
MVKLALICKCDCGKIVDVNIASVVYGNTKSCGSLRNTARDYTGQKFGRLECISHKEPARLNGATYWKCKCDCGPIADFNMGNVVSGSTSSCGCLRNTFKDYTGKNSGAWSVFLLSKGLIMQLTGNLNVIVGKL